VTGFSVPYQYGYGYGTDHVKQSLQYHRLSLKCPVGKQNPGAVENTNLLGYCMDIIYEELPDLTLNIASKSNTYHVINNLPVLCLPRDTREGSCTLSLGTSIRKMYAISQAICLSIVRSRTWATPPSLRGGGLCRCRVAVSKTQAVTYMNKQRRELKPFAL
jgi:hypothetical protein